jgi:signal transduction histidine kinase
MCPSEATLPSPAPSGEAEEISVLIRELAAERQRLARMQQEFLAVITHELRTPLAAMMGALGLLRSPRLAAQPQTSQELLEIAERNGERLLGLINDLLDLQRLEAGVLAFELEPVRVGELLDTAVRDVRKLAGLYKVQVLAQNADAAASLVTDRSRITQVLHYLLSNAIKFSPAGGEVLLAGRVCGDGVELTVLDRGPGIPEDFKGRLFESFAQAEPAAVRHHGGAGLGLSISKKIIEGLGGTIAIDSAPDTGTTVAVVLPVQAAV